MRFRCRTINNYFFNCGLQERVDVLFERQTVEFCESTFEIMGEVVLACIFVKYLCNLKT